MVGLPFPPTAFRDWMRSLRLREFRSMSTIW